MACAITACQPRQEVQRFSGPTMGSSYTVSYSAAPGTHAPAVLQQQVQALLSELDAAVSTYRADSALARFNAAPAGVCMDMPPMAITLAQHAHALAAASGGAFDVTLLPALQAWGFRHGSAQAGDDRRAQAAAPSSADLAALRPQVGMQHWHVQEQQLCKNAAVQLEFNSIAAGYAVDRVADWLAAQGIHSYLLEITGEMRASGLKPDGQPWRVAIEAPVPDASGTQRQAQKIVALQDMALSVSGDYRNWREVGGQRHSHVLDPRSLTPVRHRLAAVTVAHPSAMQADGLSTLLMVLGPEAGFDYARQHQLAALFIHRSPERDGFDSRSTPAFEALFAPPP